MSSVFALIGWGFNIVTWACWVLHWRHRIDEWPAWAGCVLANLAFALTWAVSGEWGVAAFSLSCALVSAWLFWRSWRRRKRRRAGALLGAKSRALRDALVRKTRELARPRRVLQPHPVPS